MLFEAPELDDREREVLGEIAELRTSLRFQLHEPRRWSGSLRRMSFARNIRGSNSIEGYDAALDDAAAVALGEEPIDADTETRLALEGYRTAMTYVLQMVQDSGVGGGIGPSEAGSAGTSSSRGSSTEPVRVTDQLIKSLHFMMTSYDLKNRPGRWRAGAIYVRDDRTGEIVHEGADLAEVPVLMHAVADQANQTGSGTQGEPMIRAAMAHLNLVMIHPFRDGNGRMARCLQSLVLAADGELAPVFNSVEEYLGANTQSYYDVLAEVGGGSWAPDRDTRPWIRFMLTAHLRQARTLQRRVRLSERVWVELDALATKHRLPERAITALFDAALGLRVRRSTYMATLAQTDEAITEQTASRDFKAMAEAGLLVPHGEKRGRHYTASERLRGLLSEVAPPGPRDDTDPFA